MTLFRWLPVAICVSAGQHAVAADLASLPVAPVHQAQRAHDVVMEIGLGAALRPAYEGAKDYEISPTGFFSLHFSGCQASAQ
jgi:outer membrane scaffolding protein for murein synthesis (MipA/OmpV family)